MSLHPLPNEVATVAIAKGDGIGPEIMDATLDILAHSGANLIIHPVEIGEQVYLKGEKSGISAATWETIRQTQAFLKAPITTPQGGGFKSLNVTIRTSLGLYANIRPCIAYHPFVDSKHPGMNVVIVRENEEDLYTGIEYRQTPSTYHALKIMTEEGCERIIDYAFKYALANGRKKVTCFTKDNILKLSDGIFHKTFDRIAPLYPSLQHEHWIVDIGAAKLADTPSVFDVIVMPNLYGDILSDVAAQIAGSVGLAGSANIGQKHAMFEAIHGSAPRRAGQNLANPSGLILAAILMLNHLNQPQAAALIHNAWLKTLEEGIHTYDIFKANLSKQQVGTKEFGKAVIKRLGQLPQTLKEVSYSLAKEKISAPVFSKKSVVSKKLVGADIFIYGLEEIEALYEKICQVENETLKLTMITNRGVKVWPHKLPETVCSDTWRCRFMVNQTTQLLTYQDLDQLLNRLAQQQLEYTQLENLYKFDGVPGYTVDPDE